MPNSIEEQLENHIAKEDAIFASIFNDIQDIKENHLVHLKEDISALRIDMATVKANVEWMRWGVLAIIGGIITLLFTLIVLFFTK